MDKVIQLENSIAKVELKLDAHIDDFKEHKSHFLAHERAEIKRHTEFVAVQKANTAAITLLVGKTSDMVEAWDAANGAIKVANTIGKMLKWVGGIVAAVLAIIAVYHGDKV